jgi:hypothetical protein
VQGAVAGMHPAETRLSLNTDNNGIYHRMLAKDPDGVIRAETQGWNPVTDKTFHKVSFAFPWDGEIYSSTPKVL